MEEVLYQPFRTALGGIARAFPNLILRIVEGRARFQKKLSGKVVLAREVQGLKSVSFAGQNAVGCGTHCAGGVTVGYATTIGPVNHLLAPSTIGTYCQPGPAVAFYG